MKNDDKWVPIDQRTKKQQREFFEKQRGASVPPTQIHKSAKDYDRSENQQIINDELEAEDE